MHFRSIALVFAFAGLAAAARAQTPRQVVAPAADVAAGFLRLPDPASAATRSRAAWIPLQFEREGAVWRAHAAFPLETEGALALLLVSPDASAWRLAAPAGPRQGELASARRSLHVAGEWLPGWTVARHEIDRASAGGFEVTVLAGGGERKPASGWLVVAPARALEVEAWIDTWRWLAGEPVVLAARIATPTSGARATRVRAEIVTAGRAAPLELADDGLGADELAGDGIHSAELPALSTGTHVARVDVEGELLDGERFLRSVHLAFPLVERALALDGTAVIRALGPAQIEIELGALPLAAPQRVQVAFEVWGRGSRGEPVPVAWLARIVEPSAGVAPPLVQRLDLGYLRAANATTPLELRAIRVQDPDTHAVHDEIAAIVPTGQALVPPLPAQGPNEPLALTAIGPSVRPQLLLTHGYCSGGAIWPTADFRNPLIVFQDPDANRSHDQFARLLFDRARASGATSFGVVAHSQGGPAALHLLTYYESGLDLARGRRRIQSVASPYLGTPLASLGAFACGVNNDLTPAGSTAWLAGIPTWARREVWYRTVSNISPNCNSLASIFLADPEDGTVEQVRGQLVGGNNVGHVTGWCHTTGMTRPACYTDHVRNLEMDAMAAR